MITIAATYSDYRTVWVKGRTAARTGLGAKRRVYAPPDKEAITYPEWHEYMVEQFQAIATTLPQNIDPEEYASITEPMEEVDSEQLYYEFNKQKNNKTTIEGSVPSEIWKMVYKHSTIVPKIIEKGPLKIIAATGLPPITWCCSPMWPIDKQNGKPKCRGKRPICGVCPFPRAYCRAKLRKRPIPYRMYAYGGVPGRRREEAIGIVYNVKSRCIRAGKSHMNCFRDAAGAFTSVKHNKVMSCFQKHRPYTEAKFFYKTHQYAHITISGVGTWRIGNGTLQGHSIGGDVFQDVYGEALDQYVEHKDSRQETIIFQDQPVDLSITTFVDDIGETIIADEVDEANRKAQWNTSLLNMYLHEVGCALEPSKEVVVARWMGIGAHEKVQQYLQPGVITDGQKATVARYLGAWPQHNNRMKTEVNRHIAAMRTGFYAFHGVWGSKSIKFCLKRLFFIALVTSAGIAGLEPLTLTAQDQQRLETAHVLLMRRLLGRGGWGATKTDKNTNSVPNEKVRRKSGIQTLASILRQRRLNWIRSMLTDPEHHLQYWASLFGHFEWEKHTDLDEQGVPTDKAIPALAQLYQDLKIAFPDFQGFKEETPNWQNMVLEHEDKFEHVLTYADPIKNNAPNPHPDPNRPPNDPEGFTIDTVGFDRFECPECGQQILEQQQLIGHRVKKHKYRTEEGQLVVENNQCPWCDREMSS